MRNSTFKTTTPSGHFIAPSRYYGDRYARTMEEAFGPGASLQVERRGFLERHFGFILSVLIALAIGAVSWAVQK